MSNKYKILIKNRNYEFLCKEDEYVLEALRAKRNPIINHGCHGGACGVCKSRIIKGDYEVEKTMSRAHISKEEEKEGFALLCCIKPRSDIILFF